MSWAVQIEPPKMLPPTDCATRRLAPEIFPYRVRPLRQTFFYTHSVSEIAIFCLNPTVAPSPAAGMGACQALVIAAAHRIISLPRPRI